MGGTEDGAGVNATQIRQLVTRPPSWHQVHSNELFLGKDQQSMWVVIICHKQQQPALCTAREQLASWVIYARALLEYVNLIAWVHSVNKMLPSVKFREYKVLTFLIPYTGRNLWRRSGTSTGKRLNGYGSGSWNGRPAHLQINIYLLTYLLTTSALTVYKPRAADCSHSAPRVAASCLC